MAGLAEMLTHAHCISRLFGLCCPSNQLKTPSAMVGRAALCSHSYRLFLLPFSLPTITSVNSSGFAPQANSIRSEMFLGLLGSSES